MPTPAPHVLVLFGARGDLAGRKLLPGLLSLTAAGLMPEEFRIIGSGRHAPDGDWADEAREAMEEHAADALAAHPDAWQRVQERLSFVTSSAQDGSDLAAAVRDAEQELGGEDVRRLLYLSVPPNAMLDMVGMIGREGLAERARIVMEKPFGHDVDSARELNAALHEVASEDQVFRIDHFLGKEAAQGILALRFANGLFEPAWNRDHVASVQIDVPEALGLEGRAAFYEDTGAFRDMVVTHLSQLLGFVAMEPPVHLDARGLRDEKAKLFEALRPFDPSEAVFGQYAGYRDEEGVPEDSDTETFVALRAWVDSWRWQGVPFLLRTGKALAAKGRTVTVIFREPPLAMFDHADGAADGPNELVFDLSDEPEILVDVQAKVPGPTLALGKATLRLEIAEAFGAEGLEAYARLLHDVLLGDHTLFTRADEIERLWEVAAPLQERPPALEPYERGSWGPEAALELPPGGRGWRLPDGREG